MSDPVVRAENLGKSLGGRTILRDISVRVDAGQVVGVLGKNGAGKTTLLEILLGFSPPTSGTSQVYGHDSMHLPAEVKARIGYVPQTDELVAVLTGNQQLALTAALYRQWDTALIGRLSQEWDVPLERRISLLSGGERQKLAILLALGHRPKLLVLDEPLSSLDPIARRAFLSQLLEITSDQTRSVIFSSHIVSDLERVASSIWVLREGTLRWQGDLDVMKESIVRLHVRAAEPLPSSLGVPNTLAERVTGNHAVVTVKDWQSIDQVALAAKLRANIEVETLQLEDIFLELHR